VIARGNARQPIVVDDTDRGFFLRVLDQVVKRFSWLCHAYCLMDNHYHLVIETPLPNLPSGMRQLNGRYAQRFNERHDRCGHVFESRYRSILVERESYLLELCRYVVLNPVRARLCDDPAVWPWSSYAATAGLRPPETFLTTDWLLAQFASTRGLAQKSYRVHVAEGAADLLANSVTGERLGEGDFLRSRFGFDSPLPEIPRVQVEPVPPTLEEIFADNLTTPVETAYRRHGYTLGEIANYLGCSYSTVSRRLRREEAHAAA
jgi:REP element-mobilizing transposase RayT